MAIFHNSAPQQDAGKSTVYNYNADDGISSVTDARGAVTQYTYNSIGLLEGTSWTVPPGSNIPVTAAVSLAYDAVGNRTSMTDGLGSVTYEYDEMSRMTAETRNFTDALPNAPLPGNGFRLEYGYQLGGQLKSLTDPYGQRIDYGYDKTARLQDVTSSPYGANNVTDYATGAKYRAWGGLKELNSGNGMRMTQTFDTRLRALTYQLTGAGGLVMSKSYEYNADGSASYSQDMINPKFDRLNTYDSEGRIRTAKSSAEARGQQINIDSQQKTDLPYRESFQFNAFGNLTGRTNLHWSFPNDVAYNYQNNRITNQFWSYDADGRLLRNDSPDSDSTTFTHDAAGRLTKSDRWDQSARFETNSFLDAEGRETKHWTQQWELLEPGTINPNIPPASVVKYNIRSSVLGGETVSVATETGKKERTYIHAAGVRVAMQNPYTDLSGNVIGRVTWEHRDASGLSGWSSFENGTVETFEGNLFSPVETDAIGNNMGTRNPYLEPPPSSGGSPEMEFDNRDQQTYINGQQITCALDGVPVKCNAVNSLLNTGSVARLQTYGLSSADLTQLGIITTTTPGYYYKTGNGVQVIDEGVEGGGLASEATLGYQAPTQGAIFVNISWSPQRQTPPPTNSDVALVDQAVRDVKAIFAENSECSRFFQGGLVATVRSTEDGNESTEHIFARNASIVADSLGNQLRADIGFLDAGSVANRNIAIEMSGAVTDVYNGTTVYRRFERAKVNVNGAFIKGGRFGSFVGRAGRALALLHEIAHLIAVGIERDKTGRAKTVYLIPNDKDKTIGGKDLSQASTELIEEKCKDELEKIKVAQSGN